MSQMPNVPQSVVDTLTRVEAFARSKRVTYYLVGGLLRDQLLGRPLAYLNVDLAVARGALEQARALAAHLHGAFVPLDAAQGTARVVIAMTEGGSSRRLELDVSDWRGATLEEDLSRRDVTINAMAMALHDWLRDPHQPSPLIDPLNGRRAVERRQLLACFPGTFDDDPVRILRVLRFVAQLGFTAEAPLHDLMRRSIQGLSRVSGERIREELLAIFETDRAGEAVASLNQLGALDVVFPELTPGRDLDQGGFHHLDVLGHQLESVRQADAILAGCAEFSEPLRQALASYCGEALVERRSRKSLIKLGALLHDVGKPANRQVHPDGAIWFIGHEQTGAELATQIVERLRLSNREAEMVCQLVRHHLRPGFLSREPQLTRRAIYRFYKDLGDNGPACALMWWADRLATRGRLSRLDQIEQQRSRLEEMLRPYFFQVEEIVKPPRLVDGHRLMKDLRLSPGPLVGELLDLIEEAQAEGRVHQADEAIALARERLKTARAP